MYNVQNEEKLSCQFKKHRGQTYLNKGDKLK